MVILFGVYLIYVLMWVCINFIDQVCPTPFVFLLAIINTVVLFLVANRPMLLVPFKWIGQLMTIRRLKKMVKLAKCDTDSVKECEWSIVLKQAEFVEKMLFWGRVL